MVFAADRGHSQPPPAHALKEQRGAFNPLEHPGWDSLVAAHPGSSFFHQSAWARVLRETYGHQPVYFCGFADGRLDQLLPIMEVSSVWTGCRGVSLPFTDVCPPLQSGGRGIGALYELAAEQGRRRGWRYLECRGGGAEWPGASPSLAFHGHEIPLGPRPEVIFKNCESAVRRGIRKAEAAGLKVEFANSADSVRTFYGLHCRTRQRHGVPPQPYRFFESILRHVLGPGFGVVEVVRLGGRAVAAAVFFHSKQRAHYKYGASDMDFQAVRPNNLMMWEAMKRYAEAGLESLHLGRTSLANEGLRRFKLGFGAREERIVYNRYDFRKGGFVQDQDHAEGPLNGLLRRLPGPLLRLAGRAVYPHVA